MCLWFVFFRSNKNGFSLTGLRKLCSIPQEACFQDITVRKMVTTFCKMFFEDEVGKFGFLLKTDKSRHQVSKVSISGSRVLNARMDEI